MALNIEDEGVDRLARELARKMDTTITAAIRHALEKQLALVSCRPAEVEDLSAIITRGRARRQLDNRPESEILGYGDDGAPV